MKHLKYKVVVNSENDETKEYLFKTMKEICVFLNISYGSLYSLRSGRLKCKHYSKKHLSNISIEKIDFDRTHYLKKKGIDPTEFIKSLDDKYIISA